MRWFLGGLTVAMVIANPVWAQFVSKVSVSQELKRLGTACVKFVEVGPVGMPDFTKAGYKLNKQGLGGKDFFANKSLNNKKVDTSTLAKGTGLGAMVDWHNGRRNECEFSISLRTEQDRKLVLKIERDMHGLVKSMGYRQSTQKDSKGRLTHIFVKGENELVVRGSWGDGRKDRKDGYVSFTIQNRNSASRKN